MTDGALPTTDKVYSGAQLEDDNYDFIVNTPMMHGGHVVY